MKSKWRTLMSWKLPILLLLLPLALVAAEQPAQVKADSDGKTITLKVGDHFDITLEENASTGYSWRVIEGLGGVVEQLGEPDFHSNSSDPNLVGAGGTVTYHFKAAGIGTTTLKLVYHRSWEKDKPPAKTFQVTVVVSS
jgi:inhibitor of cysteine peptidase